MKPGLVKQGWSIIEPVSQDGSSRHYYRVEKNNRRAILMDCSGPETPGHSLKDYIRINEWLRSVDLNAPEIYEAGDDYAIVEDFGSISFKAALQTEGVEQIYGVATSVLNELAKAKNVPVLPEYKNSAIDKGHRRIIDWYVPAIKNQKNSSGLVEEYLDIWQEIEKNLPPLPMGFIHCDYHAENLMWVPHEKGLKRCGIIDFQGAMKGPLPYDMANILEDARTDAPPDVREFILSHYDSNYRKWYRIMGTQFHCRVIGQFIKMAVNGKPQYLQYIPRVQSYIQDALKDPLLAPLKKFFAENKIGFQTSPDITNIKTLVAPDAF